MKIQKNKTFVNQIRDYNVIYHWNMKIKTLLLVAALTCLTFPSLYASSFYFGVGVGGPRHYHRHYRYETWHRPVVIYEDPAPVVVHEYVTPSSDSSIPYGDLQGGSLKSPWSDFTMSVGGKASGQIVYDPNNGKAFRVP